MYLRSLSFLKNKYAPDGSYQGDIFIMTVGRIVSQIVPIAAIPILSRLYSPGDFGVFAIFLAIVAISTFFANFRYNQAMILPKKEEDAIRLFALSVILNIITSGLFAILIYIFQDNISNLLNLDASNLILYLMPVGMILAGLMEPLHFLGLRKRLYKVLASTLIFKFTLIAALKISFGFVDIGSFGLVLGHILGLFLGVLVLFLLLVKARVFMKFRSFLNRKSLMSLAFTYRKFPIYSLPGSMLHEFSRQVPNLLLNSFFGSAVVGYFSINQRILHSPISLISGGIRDVFRERASADYRESGSCRSIFVATLRKLALLGIIPFVLLFFFAPALIPVILGAQWTPAGEYIRILSFMYFLVYLVSPLGVVLYIAEKQSYKLLWEIILVFSILVSFWVGFIWFDEYIAIAIYAFTTSILYVMLLLISYRYTVKR